MSSFFQRLSGRQNVVRGEKCDRDTEGGPRPTLRFSSTMVLAQKAMTAGRMPADTIERWLWGRASNLPFRTVQVGTGVDGSIDIQTVRGRHTENRHAAGRGAYFWNDGPTNTCHPERGSQTTESKGPHKEQDLLFFQRRSVLRGILRLASLAQNDRLIRAVVAVLVIVLTVTGAHAADDVILRTSVQPDQAWVGQRAMLVIEVLGAEGWAQIKDMGTVELSGAYVMRTESQGVRLSETIGGTSYTGQRYQLSVYCQRPGRLKVPALPVTVSVKQWGATPPETTRELETPATELICRTPPGAENIRGLISTTRLEADQSWSARPESAAPGGALTRTVTLSADDVSGMAFPPMQNPEIAGVATYPSQPSVADETNRGSLLGLREGSVTYVFEEPGTVILPDIVLSWWDIGAGRLRRIELPGLEIEVVGVTTIEGNSVEAAAEPTPQPRDFARTVLLIIPIASFGLWLSTWLFRWLRGWWAARSDSEPIYFRRVQAALRGGDPTAITAAIASWLDRLDTGSRPARLDLFLDEYGDDATRAVSLILTERLADGETFTDGRILAAGLKLARRRLLRARKCRRSGGVLPPLNG